MPLGSKRLERASQRPRVAQEAYEVAIGKLDRTKRARVVEAVLASLEEPNEHVAAAWAGDLERRSREIAEGRIQSVDWDAARAQILKELEQRRAGRSSS